MGWRLLARAAAPDESTVTGETLSAEVASAGSQSSADTAAVARLENDLVAACDVAASHVVARYPELPDRGASDPPTALSSAVVAIVLGRLAGGEERRAAAKDAQAWLRSVARGEVVLDVDADGTPAESPRTAVSKPADVFTTDLLDRFAAPAR